VRRAGGPTTLSWETVILGRGSSSARERRPYHWGGLWRADLRRSCTVTADQPDAILAGADDLLCRRGGLWAPSERPRRSGGGSGASPAASIHRAAHGAPLVGGRFVAPPLIASAGRAHRAAPHERPWPDRRVHRGHAVVLQHQFFNIAIVRGTAEISADGAERGVGVNVAPPEP
jgi:hypothetical protein